MRRRFTFPSDKFTLIRSFLIESHQYSRLLCATENYAFQSFQHDTNYASYIT